MIFCTACTTRDLPAARLLAEDLARVDPSARPLVALVLGPPRGADGIDVLTPDDLEIPGWDRLVAATPVDRLVERMRPLLLRHLLLSAGEPVVYLDAHMEVRAPLAPAIAERLARTPVLLLPRLVEPLPRDGLLPDAGSLAEHGEIDPGLVAVDPRPEALDLVRWWVDEAGDEDDEHGGDLSALPTAYGDVVGVQDDPRWGVSAWNLHARPLAGAELISFEGFRADRPYWLREDFTRVRVLDDDALAEACARRAQRLLAAGWRARGLVERTRQRLVNGLRYDERLKRLHGWALASGEEVEDLDSDEGAAALVAFATAPVPPALGVGLSRYLYDVYAARPDLQTTFPDLAGPDGPAFRRWAWEWGRDELGLAPELLPPLDDGPPAAGGAPDELAVELLGYFDGNLGLGQAARSYAAALRAAGVQVTTRNVRSVVSRAAGGGEDERTAERGYDASEAGREPSVSIICVNAPQILDLVQSEGSEVFAGDRYRIGVWAWETDVVPDFWDRCFQYVDEVWVYSAYIRDVLAPVSPVPVTVAPLALDTAPPAAAELPPEVPRDGFLFAFTFDMFSTIERKNPAGAIEAFTRAFAPGEGPRLLVKTLHGDARPRQFSALRAAAGDRDDIVILDAALEPGAQAALLERADCFVSLHRSEGWGLGLAESMAMGKPAIATAYSGNLDFMTPENSYLVAHGMTRVGGETEIYPADGRWAEPDLDDAARVMRHVYEHQDEARARGARAADDVRAQLDAGRVGRALRLRLERVVPAAMARRAPSEDAGAAPDIDALGDGLAGDPLRPALASRALTKGLRAGLAGHLALRDAKVAETAAVLRRLQAELDGARAEGQADRAALANLARRVYAAEERARGDRVALAELERELRRLADGR